MKKVFFLFFSFLFLAFLFILYPQQAAAQTVVDGQQPIPCTCKGSGTSADYHCTGTVRFNNPLDGGAVTTVNVDDDFKCQDLLAICNDDPEFTQQRPIGLVLDVPIKGIKCTGGTNTNPIIDLLTRPSKAPAPPPPCSEFSDGECVSVETSLGDISTVPGEFVGRIAGILISGAGGIAVLLIMRSGYRIMTSRGNPEAIQQGREQFTAAVVGLLFIIFSFVILEVIGVDLLRIPGSTGTPPPGNQPQPNESCACTATGTCNADGGTVRAGGSCSGGQVYCCVERAPSCGCIGNAATCRSEGGTVSSGGSCTGGDVYCCIP